MPGITVLFWNINRQPLAGRVGRLQQTHSADVVILAECVTDSSVVSRTLNAVGSGGFHVVAGSAKSLRVFTRLPLGGMDHLTDLRVLESDGTESPLTPNGLPDATAASDHLPGFFRLEW
jgi:hypothetical protein